MVKKEKDTNNSEGDPGQRWGCFNKARLSYEAPGYTEDKDRCCDKVEHMPFYTAFIVPKMAQKKGGHCPPYPARQPLWFCLG